MTIANISASEEQSQYVGQFYQENYAKLRRYFLPQLGCAAEADECVRETMRHFFFFMQDRCWEAEAKRLPVYLMRIAGSVCTKKLVEKRGRRESTLLGRLRNEVTETLSGRGELRHLLTGAWRGSEGSRAKHLPALRHVRAASA